MKTAAKFWYRFLCHRNLWCCQYQDEPNCNSWNDPHALARWRYRHRARTEA
jgi:hypothetical protein